MSQKYFLLTFESNCVNFSLELKKYILNHSVTSKQPLKIVQIHMAHPVLCDKNHDENIANSGHSPASVTDHPTSLEI
jgi:hypothetical protein